MHNRNLKQEDKAKISIPLDNSFRTIRPLVIILFFLKHP